ncbi:helix-turn-helix transcriptional regulator [Nocardioides lianchengensis]|uniref:Helix-turn-helix domain-containing protein n=1 Tax=Nocardioides lianchengensis TaxID=1045774 RepID=A0A1G6WC33_9ACTN|nr:helix-turn-helix transcriptional regulator [Nocardioides lianchengensis]NYG09389.1 transcriptional regulator with XRE-family HTH domain [Nocardioides lianchengensis]SDD62606.1 Helix-turn-helix domain-containing protein [Nocardioides lianchengensis]
MSDDNLLGDHLRARREQVTPEMVGLPVHGVRRVAGLRREEVALLAGISSDYYLRLEQGRDRNPSVQVLEALARVLQLDATATDYLLGLGSPRPRSRTRRPRRETVPPQIAQLLEVIGLPAFVEGRFLDILAANRLMTALMPSVQVGENRLRSLFLDPAERALFLDWETLAPRMIAGLRKRIGSDIDDPRFVQLVGELSVGSDEFRRGWARHDVKPLQSKVIRLDHPQVGELSLAQSKLAVEGAEGQILAIYHPEPGTDSAERLALLGSLLPTSSIAP